MNKGYIAYGTYKDLKAKGLISKEGGFLGIGKKESLHQDFANSCLHRSDITRNKEYPGKFKVCKTYH